MIKINNQGPDLAELVREAELEIEKEAWNLNSLPEQKRNSILEKYDKHQRKIGSWRRLIPMYGLRYEYNGIDAHWGVPRRILWHATSAALIGYGLMKLVEKLIQ